MKIIKPGLSKDKLKPVLKQFMCITCGCIFEADDNEYKCEEKHQYCTYFCKCPNCGKRGYETIKF